MRCESPLGRGWATIIVGHGNLKFPSQPWDVTHPRYSLASEVNPGGLDGGGLLLENLQKV
jgi:hypothetical protein